MPREIIDTQASRPAYIRRNILLASLVAVVVAIVLLYAFQTWSAGQRPALPVPRHSQNPGK